VLFFDLFASPAPEFEEDSLRVIQEDWTAPRPGGVARAARLVQAYELMYWDALHQASQPA
jgi:hypothetical protein